MKCSLLATPSHLAWTPKPGQDVAEGILQQSTAIPWTLYLAMWGIGLNLWAMNWDQVSFLPL